MLVVFVILAALVVVALALGTVGTVVARLADSPAPAVYQVHDAVDWIAGTAVIRDTADGKKRR